MAAKVSTWGDRLKRARNTLALMMLGALFAFRAGVSWRRWQRSRLAAADDALYQAKAAGGRGEFAAGVQPEGKSRPTWRAFDHAAQGNAG